jgi:hypothetical protein
MDVYRVQKLLFHMYRQPEIVARFDADRDALFDAYRLDAEERRMLATGDVGALYAAGVHPLLLAPFGAHCGLKWPDYIEAMDNPGPTIGAGDAP